MASGFRPRSKSAVVPDLIPLGYCVPPAIAARVFLHFDFHEQTLYIARIDSLASFDLAALALASELG